MIASDLKTGVIFKENNTPYVVVKYTHTKVARGGATVKVKARNLKDGGQVDRNYKANDKVEDADVVKKNAQYIYKDLGRVFMDPDTFEQFVISDDILGDSAQFLIEGEKVAVQYFEGRPISVELPNSLSFTVTYTEPGFKGNTVSTVMKDATLDNGAIVKVPSFIKIGDKIKINTSDGSYISKG